MLKGLRKQLGMIGECFAMSFDNIIANKMRSFLTVLGILIGVTAVITLITTMNAFSGSLSDSFSSMGTGTLTVSISGSDLKSGLDRTDMDELVAMDIVDGLTPTVSLSARVSRNSEYKTRVSVSGKNAYYFRRNEIVKRGRALNVVDEDNMSYVCLIDESMVSAFFYGVDPIGEELYIAGIPYLVVGIFSTDGAESIAGLLSGSANILIPYTTALKMNSESLVTSFTLYLTEGIGSAEATTPVSETLDAMFSFEEDCYTITDMSGIENTLSELLSMVSVLLAGIASIALLVGGIGIMNMMLTTVTERTIEIGLKKALGAIPWQIQLQFLIESFLLSMIGGIAGVGLGMALSAGLCGVLGSDFVVSMEAIALGVGFSAAVGIIFGWAPARKASRLNPIEALRSA